MKSLRIIGFQETTCYTRPFANKVTETYPLPPYSTVKGMIHSILNAEKLIPFSLCIQGDYESMIVDYRKIYFVKKSTVNMPIIFDGLPGEYPIFPDMTSMPLYTHMLYNINLVIHLKADDAILSDIYRSFECLDTYPSLGRQEDLLRIDSVDIVNLDELDVFEGRHLSNSMYIPNSYIYEDELSNGIPYQLNWTYNIKNGIREWNRIPTTYFQKGQFINSDIIKDESIFVDDNNNVVIWNE